MSSRSPSPGRACEALEQERHELEAIVDGATDLIVQVDAEGLVVRLNPAGERLLGTSATAAVGRTCADVLGCEVAGAHAPRACPLAEVRLSGVPIAYREASVVGADGQPLRVAGSYAAAPGGVTARATAILRDMSAVRALEELREGFVATVSHELRTPLALIRGYAETLLHFDLDSGEQRAYVERIDEASRRLASLVDQVLDVTHLQADPLILDRSATTFAALVARLRGDLAISGGADRLVESAPADLPPVDVDVARVGQILANLVGNALKYAPDGSPVVISAETDGPWLARRSTTKASASPRMIARWSPSRSTEPGTSGNRGSPGRVSACSSAGAWSRPTAGACRWVTGSMADREHG